MSFNNLRRPQEILQLKVGEHSQESKTSGSSCLNRSSATINQHMNTLQLYRLFSSEPLASNPRNHCAPLLDVIELPNDPPIMVHSQLRTYYNPPFHTFGEFVAFFGQICDVRCSFSPYILIHARESRRSSVSASFYDPIHVCYFVCQGLQVRKHHP